MSTEIIFVLDRSGSMAKFRNATISGFNSMINKQKNEEDIANWTTVVFNHTIELLHNAVNIEEVNLMTGKDFLPKGRTALFDAVGSTIELVSARMNKKNLAGNGDNGSNNKVIFIIMTDGLENASRKFTQFDINKIIAEKKLLGWEFIYLGADVSEARDAEDMGIKSDRRYFYEKTKQRDAYEGVSLNIASYRKNHTVSDNWKEDMEINETNLPYLNCIEGCFIVDTGSPNSFGTTPTVTINNKSYRLGANPIIKDVQKNLGSHIKGLVGMDILMNYDVVISYDDLIQKFNVDLNDSMKQSEINQEVPLLRTEFLMGVPVISVIVKDEESKFFLDSGSSISYMREPMIDKKNICGSKKDFYPLFGSFITNIYSTELAVLGDNYRLQFGLLPDLLQDLLPQGIDGILGSDFIRRVPLKLGFKSKEFKPLNGNGGNSDEK